MYECVYEYRRVSADLRKNTLDASKLSSVRVFSIGKLYLDWNWSTLSSDFIFLKHFVLHTWLQLPRPEKTNWSTGIYNLVDQIFWKKAMQ